MIDVLLAVLARPMPRADWFDMANFDSARTASIALICETFLAQILKLLVDPIEWPQQYEPAAFTTFAGSAFTAASNQIPRSFYVQGCRALGTRNVAGAADTGPGLVFLRLCSRHTREQEQGGEGNSGHGCLGRNWVCR